MPRGTPVEIGGKVFQKKGEARDFIDSIRTSYDPGDSVSAEDTSFLLKAINSHPDYDTKFPSPVTSFFVGLAEIYNTKCLFAQMENGTSVQFSGKSLVPVKKRK
ncbi:MAG: DUF3223 domain-containing protein [Litorimonas sp.]